VKNWMMGRDHPRCKAADIAKLAAAVGVQTKDIARFVSRRQSAPRQPAQGQAAHGPGSREERG
jgi:hypothetical protein